jgi:predicted RNase H-related nuclease YkuK (DUF458 family)
MSEEVKEKDNFILYVVMLVVVAIGVILMVKKSEVDKFAPIREQINEEIKLMNIRVLKG